MGNALPAADARGVAVINALVSEEDGEEFTSRESEHAHRDKDQGRSMCLFLEKNKYAHTKCTMSIMLLEV